MNIKLKVTKSKMYDLVKTHIKQMNSKINAEEISKLRDSEFKRSLRGSFYQLEFSVSNKWYRASLESAFGSVYLQIKDKDPFEVSKMDWQTVIDQEELKRRSMIATTPDQGEKRE